MAINTRRKRQNAAQVGAPVSPSVLPNGAVDAFERAQSTYTYGGIAIVSPVAGGTPMLMMLGMGS